MCLYWSCWELRETCREGIYFSWKGKLWGGGELFLDFESPRAKNGWPGAIVSQVDFQGSSLPIFSLPFWAPPSSTFKGSELASIKPPLLASLCCRGLRNKKQKCDLIRKGLMTITVSSRCLMSPRKLESCGSACLYWPQPPIIPDCVPRTALQWTFLGDRTLTWGVSAKLAKCNFSAEVSLPTKVMWQSKQVKAPRSSKAEFPASPIKRWKITGGLSESPPHLEKLGFLLPTAVLLSSKDQSEVGHFLPWRALRGGSLSPPDRPCLSLVHFSKFLGLETFPSTSI